MSAKSERPKNRKVRIVGGGFRWTRQPNGKSGGSMKARKRVIRKRLKAQGAKRNHKAVAWVLKEQGNA